MTIRFLSTSKASAVLLLFCSIFLFVLPGIISSRVVTLGSIEIFKTHEWLSAKPTVYFQCQGENGTILPDVKKTNFLYTFKGEESWQPLTKLVDKKCKRCGLYEEDTLKPNDIFDEWEFCSSDFMAPDGKYARFKDKEFNATFFCPQCITLETGSNHDSGSHSGGREKRMNVVLVIMISALVSAASILGAVAAYRYWQRKKREQDQARFLKLFEDGDDIEDELGLGHMI